jgi:hypothetical protein
MIAKIPHQGVNEHRNPTTYANGAKAFSHGAAIA